MSTVADQFAEILAMAGGRAGEVLDLVVTNLWR
jgi:hypothetical protein